MTKSDEHFEKHKERKLFLKLVGTRRDKTIKDVLTYRTTACNMVGKREPTILIWYMYCVAEKKP